MSDWNISGFSGVNNMLGINKLDQPSVTKTGNYGSSGLTRCINFDIDNSGSLIKRDNQQAIFSKDYDAKLTQVLGARTFTASGSLLRYTKPFSDEYDEKKSSISYPDPIVMLIPVEIGMWVSTTQKIYYHSGKNPTEIGGFAVTSEYDFPAIMGTGERIHASKMSLENDGFVALFSTTKGICYGTQTGMLHNISESVFSYVPGLRGISYIKEENGIIQYQVKMINQNGESFNPNESKVSIEVDSQ